jgi:hypothetical protein
MSDDKEKKGELNQKMKNSKDGSEKTRYRKQILDINKKLINSDVKHLELETEVRIIFGNYRLLKCGWKMCECFENFNTQNAFEFFFKIIFLRNSGCLTFSKLF